MTQAVVERSLRLPARADSPGHARRLVDAVLGDCGRERWRDAAELAVTEVVTNVVLHAHTELELRLRCDGDVLHVEVEDYNLAVPAQRRYRADATTGRGLGLVAALSTAHGVTATATGKVVWFDVDDAPPEAPDDLDALLDAWADDAAAAPAEQSTGSVTLVGLPPTLWSAATQQHDAVLRELSLLRGAAGSGTDDLAAADRARYALSSALDRALGDADARRAARTPLPPGHPATLAAVPPALDLPVRLDSTSAADFAVLQDVLDEAQRLALAGRLLVRPALPEIVALRDWLCDQVIAQSAGQPPRPWPGADGEHVPATGVAARPVDLDLTRFTGPGTSAIVVDAYNRLVGISAGLAAEIGWAVDELVGRRVVAIVPPTYREAHTAGFTRHLTTGEAHALGVELQLPVLHADGTDHPYTFFIEAAQTDSDQPVYVARLTPARD